MDFERFREIGERSVMVSAVEFIPPALDYVLRRVGGEGVPDFLQQFETRQGQIGIRVPRCVLQSGDGSPAQLLEALSRLRPGARVGRAQILDEFLWAGDLEEEQEGQGQEHKFIVLPGWPEELRRLFPRLGSRERTPKAQVDGAIQG